MTPPRDYTQFGEKIGDLTATVRGLAEQVKLNREAGDKRHDSNTGKLDQLLGLSPMVNYHETWIKTKGEPAAEAVADFASQVKGASKAAKFGYSLGGGIGALGLYVVVKVVPFLHAMLP